jgi:hypothetical protein
MSQGILGHARDRWTDEGLKIEPKTPSLERGALTSSGMDLLCAEARA